jgi:hypothetical protein
MPATAGRSKMPHNNRMHTSGTLKTHGVWKQVIKYDPYAAEGEDSEARPTDSESYKSYMQLARLSGNTSHMKNRGACRKCGMMGHMTFQCRNTLGRVEKDDEEESSSEEEDEEKQSRVRKRRDDSDDEDSDEEERRARKRRKKEKRRKKKKKKKRKKKKRKKKSKKKTKHSDSESSSSSDSDSD